MPAIAGAAGPPLGRDRASDPPSGWEAGRADFQRRLEQTDGRHLVLVRYGPDHNPHSEWVYNPADFPGAKVLWARELDPSRARRLVDAFKDRRAWLLEPDAKPVRLVPYPPAEEPAQ